MTDAYRGQHAAAEIGSGCRAAAHAFTKRQARDATAAGQWDGGGTRGGARVPQEKLWSRGAERTAVAFAVVRNRDWGPRIRRSAQMMRRSLEGQKAKARGRALVGADGGDETVEPVQDGSSRHVLPGTVAKKECCTPMDAELPA